MEKIRIYQLAKELNTTSKRLMEKLAEINIEVKNHMSLLGDDELKALYGHIGVISHSDDDEGEMKKLPKPPAPAKPPGPVKRKPANREKSGPRIIRKTEIILDSEGDSEQSTRKQNKKNKKKRRDYVKIADDTSGLRAGFRRNTDNSLEDLRNTAKVTVKNKAEEKPLKKKKKSIEQAAANKNNTDGKQNAETKLSGPDLQKDPAEAIDKNTVKEHKTNNKKRVTPMKTVVDVKEEKQENKEQAAAREKKKEAIVPKKDAADKSGQAEASSKDNRSYKQKDKPAGKKKPENQAKAFTKERQAGSVKRDGKQEKPAAKYKKDTNIKKTYNDKDKKDRPANKSNTRAQTKKPLNIPQPESSESEKTSKDTSRGERRRSTLKDTRKESSKKDIITRPVKKKKFQSQNIVIPGVKKDVSEVMSDDFEFDEFYKEYGKKKKNPKYKREEEKNIDAVKQVQLTIKVPEHIVVKELAERLKKTATEVIKKLMNMGLMVTVNEEVDFETANIVADEFNIKVEKEVEINKEEILFDDAEEDSQNMQARAPIVVVMGHVDHGKTSLLDAIREANVIGTEAGGITQHIGAYMVNTQGRDITFLDTPGHEAFTSLRARGAQVTDIAILVVAADDGIMPQTVEAINHAKAANVTIIVAINKMDKPGANPDKIMQQLTEHGLVSEEWGGDIICVPISALKRENIDQLLEMVLLSADMLELKADPDKQVKGTVIEARLDKNRGVLATLLVQRGTLKLGDSIISGTTVGRIRAMVNDKGQSIDKASPSTPVEILGLPEVPLAGELFYGIEDEKMARQLVEERRAQQREEQLKVNSRVSLDDLFSQIKEGMVKDLNIIVKADVQGSVEAVKQSLEKLSNDEVKVKIIHGAVGAVTESDVSLAEVSNAIIIGFNVRPAANVMEAAENANVDIRLYRIIYNAIEDIEAAMKGMLDPTFKEVVQGHAEVRQLFKVSGVGTIAGCYLTDGKITRASGVRLVRSGIVVHEGELASLKRFKDDVKEVVQGYECGISFERYNDLKEGDIIEAYIMEEVKRD